MSQTLVQPLGALTGTLPPTAPRTSTRTPTRTAARASLRTAIGASSTGRRRIRAATALGPAFVAAIAYVDPGNFATNFQGGASSGYQLVWVVILANLVAMPVQYLSAKLGMVTGKTLPRLCREALPRSISWLVWLQAEVVSMATDLAEFVGAAIGLNLLFRMPLPVAGGVTAVLAFVVLALQRRGYRSFEVGIGALLMLICAGFLYLTLRIEPSATGTLSGLVPSIGGHDTLLLAVGIVGATVMPHAIYLHSGLTNQRLATGNRQDRGRLLRLQRLDIGLAMGLAGLVNLSMLVMAAKLFHHAPSGPAAGGVQRAAGATMSLQDVHLGLGTMVGGGAALAFAAALLASGISSSSVGTAAGQVVMEGFLGTSIPLWLRRLITMTPALVLLCSGVDPTRALVLSQVVLSFGIPIALIALLVLTSRRALMGKHANRLFTIVAMGAVVVLISGLNVLLVVRQISG